MSCFWKHKYGPWGKPYEATIKRTRGSFGDTSTDDCVMQDRQCERCGKIDSRHVRDGKLNTPNNV